VWPQILCQVNAEIAEVDVTTALNSRKNDTTKLVDKQALWYVDKRLLSTTTRNLAIANRSRDSSAYKVTTVSKSPKWPPKASQGHQNVTVRYSAYDFLLPFYSNYGLILYRFPHRVKFIHTHVFIASVWEETPSEFHKDIKYWEN